MFENSKWIWTKNNNKANDWVRFCIDFKTEEIKKSIFNIAAETKYYLYVNGVLTVFDGGLFRESTTGNGYYDSVDITPNLKKGSNSIIIDVWFYGNGGRNNNKLDSAGVIFECESLNLISSKDIKCGTLQAYYNTEGENPAFLYGGYNIGFNALNDTIAYENATEHASNGDKPFNQLEKRPIPLFKFSDEIQCNFTENECGDIIVKLPYAMHFSPYIKVEANGGEVIDIRSDRYSVNGGPADYNKYNGHRYEYICKKGIQEYNSYNWIFGEEIILKIPQSIKILSIGYRESGYDSNIKTNFNAKDSLIEKLLNKCARTLYICMRENFMDCPDRERGQWIGDVSVQAPQVFLCMDDNARMLLKKAIYDFIRLRKGDILLGNVPGDNSQELPAQSLNAISEIGMLATYYNNTKEIEVLQLAYKPCINYLKLWEIKEDGLISQREGGWYWFDHGYNVDNKVLENCWYYSALKYALFMAKELKITEDDSFLISRIKSIEDNFNKHFWKERFYSSKGFADDRANAMAVLTGLAEKEKYSQLSEVLVSVFNSTTYMEYYILEALCKMGYKEQAYKRMISRYYPLIINENTTLWEDFYLLGTKNHAWTGSPLTIINKYFKELL